MSIPEIVIVKNASGAIQVAELVGGSTINQIGLDLAATTSEATTNALIYTNRAVEYRGQIYAIQYSSSTLTIKVYNRGTGLWTVSDTPGGSALPVGLFLVNTGTVLRLVLLYTFGANTFERHTDDGTTWTGDLQVVTGASISNVGPAVNFGNKIYFTTLNNGVKINEVDPVAGSGTTIIPPFSAPSVGDACVDYCPFDDRLFALTPGANNAGSSGSDWQLYEFTGGGFSLNTDITTDNRLINIASVNVRQGQPSLFKEPTSNKLIALCNGTDDATSAGSGITCFELTPSGSAFTVSDITNTVVPAGLRPGARGSNINFMEDRILMYINNDTDMEVAEAYAFIATGPAPGTGFGTYTWNGVDSVMTLLAAGPSTDYAIVHQKIGGGGRINRGTGNQIVIENGGAVLGGYRINYRVYGTQSGQTLSGYYSVSQETPTTKMTISAQTGGSGITGGDTVTGITGDDGVTLFTLDWDLVTDGVANGDTVTIELK